jgi:hypothetical protein
VPTIRGVQALVAPAKRALLAFGPVERKATPAIASLASALPPTVPILSAVRPYLPDLQAGFFSGVGGDSGGYYDANGRFIRVMPVISGTGGALTGVLGLLGGLTSALPVLNGTTTGNLAPCPGGGAPPASDRSNAWTSSDSLPAAGTFCNPAHDQR